jgi:hypothetical protein
MRRKTGIALLVAAYALFLNMALAAPAYARLHTPFGATMLCGLRPSVACGHGLPERL